MAKSAHKIAIVTNVAMEFEGKNREQCEEAQRIWRLHLVDELPHLQIIEQRRSWGTGFKYPVRLRIAWNCQDGA